MTDTDVERLARIGELLRLRDLIIATHEEQPEHIECRLQALYPPDFLALTVEAKGQGQEPPDFLTWHARQGAKT